MRQPFNICPFICFHQIFFRANVLHTLESQRDEKLSGIFTQLQARCRGYLARKDYAKRKVNDIAVRCIQRNVKKFMVVRDWPWWRLLVRITPLLNVHRTEIELKQKSVSIAHVLMTMTRRVAAVSWSSVFVIRNYYRVFVSCRTSWSN